LGSPTDIGSHLEIVDNYALINLSGLENITNIEGDIKIFGNTSLIDLNGLQHLTSTQGGLAIGWNDAITSLSGLENISFIGGNLSISSNTILTNLTGLNNLASVEGHVRITSNDSLINASGLNSLTSIGGELKIIYNYELADISGVENIDPASIGDLIIYNNYELPNCAVQSICDYLVSPNGTVEIHNNAAGCNSQAEVELACETISIPEISNGTNFYISPNPSESVTSISYTLDHASPVSLMIFDLKGRLIKTLVDELQGKGDQKVIFDGIGLTPGVYFCALKTNEGELTKELVKL
jgi:hypothetical protein